MAILSGKDTSVFAEMGSKVSELDEMGILYQTEGFLAACISLVHKLDKP